MASQVLREDLIRIMFDVDNSPMRDVLRDLERVRNQSQRAGKAIDKMKGELASLGNTAKTAAVAGLTAVGTAMGGLIAYSVKVGSEFEKSMSTVQAISGASGESLQRLTDKAKEMGRTTAFSASEAAEAMKFMAMAGWKEKDIINGIGGVMNLAAASGESLGSVSDIVTDAMTAFKMSSDQAGRFSDVLAAVATNSNTNVGMLGYSFKQTAALAGTMGYSIEDVSLALGLMANAGIKGETAGMALKNTIANMASPTAAMQKVMTNLGLSLTDSSGNMKDFRTVLGDIRKGFQGLSKDEQAAAAANLFGKEAMAGMLAIVGSSEEDFNKLAGAIDNSSGSAKKMADTMLDNLQGQFTMLKSVTEGIGISIYDKFKKPLTAALKGVTVAFEGMASSIEGGALSGSLESLGTQIGNAMVGIANAIVAILPQLIAFIGMMIDNGPTIVSVVAGIGAAFAAWRVVSIISTIIAGVKAYTVALQGATLAQKLMNLAMKTNIIGVIITAVIFLVTILVTLWHTNDNFRNAVLNAWDTIKAAFVVAGQYIMAALTAVGSFFVSIGSAIGGFAQAAWGVVVTVFTAIFNFYVTIWTAIFTFIAGILQAIWGVFGPVLTSIWTLVTTVFSYIGQIIAVILQGIWAKIVEIWTAIWGFISPILLAILNFYITIWTAIFTFIAGILQTIWGKIVAIWQACYDFIAGIMGSVSSTVSGIWSSIVDAVGGFLGDIYDTIVDKFNEGLAFLEGLKDSFVSVGGDLINGLLEGITNKMGELTAKVHELGGKVLDGVREVFGVHSPSKEFAIIGRYNVEGLEKGMLDELSNLGATTRVVGETVLSDATTASQSYEPSNDVMGRGGVSETNYFNPQFNLTVNGGDRNTEAKVKQWVREALEDTFESMGRRNPRLQEV